MILWGIFSHLAFYAIPLFVLGAYCLALFVCMWGKYGKSDDSLLHRARESVSHSAVLVLQLDLLQHGWSLAVGNMDTGMHTTFALGYYFSVAVAVAFRLLL